MSISTYEFDSTIFKMSGKTPGADKISYTILKNLPYALKNRLVNLYNDIFTSGVFPQAWKSALIIPIPKPNKPSNLTANFRAISLLPCISKILEKIIAVRIMWFAKINGFISFHQFGFQKGVGVIESLLYFEHFSNTALASSNHVSVLKLDFEKAFDRIGIHVVLRQLKRWKVGTKIFNFVKTFLNNRKLSVSVRNYRSQTYKLTNGIPQGSPLSVTLFTIAFNEISSIITSNSLVEHFTYADDVLIFSKIKDFTEVNNIFSSILSNICKWSECCCCCF